MSEQTKIIIEVLFNAFMALWATFLSIKVFSGKEKLGRLLGGLFVLYFAVDCVLDAIVKIIR
jgi:hypothetical protein